LYLFDTTQTGLERAISGASLRQTTLAGNIANANTPGYRRRDVDFHTALRGAMGEGTEALERVSFSAQPDAQALLRADGNGVDIDVEAANLARNGLEYEGLVTVARARMDIMRSAMGVA
jgi:flagellar basal-body rod protein FlgB